eukprot:scaffold23195_cov51-Attheya_sp.AAC.3
MGTNSDVEKRDLPAGISSAKIPIKMRGKRALRNAENKQSSRLAVVKKIHENAIIRCDSSNSRSRLLTMPVAYR